MQSSSIRRQVKNMVNNFTEAEVKVREATSNDHWGPSSTLMAEIADLTYNVVTFAEVMGIIWKRLNDHGKNWRQVYKALTLLDYLVKSGSERVAKAARENIFAIQTLKDFQYLDRDGRDQGVSVREKAKQLVALLKDEEKLKRERSNALKTKSRLAGVVSSSSGSSSSSSSSGYVSASYTSRQVVEDFSRCRSPPSTYNTPSSRLAPDLEQAIPSTSGEEELQLQLALAMSREESEKPVRRAPPATADMDEDAQLQLALSLSKEEHKQEQLSRRGDETELQKALEESKREMEGKGGTAFMDLVDVFAVPVDAPPIDSRWNNTSTRAASGVGGTDPWDSPDVPRADSPWMVPPPSHSPPPPWEPPSNSWVAAQNGVSPLLTGRDVAFSGASASMVVDPFLAPPERTAARGATSNFPPQSPTDGDFFDEAMDGGNTGINGQRVDSPDLYELSSLRESLINPTPRACQTPESFLGPSAASLVNLDSLIPTNPSAKTTNPFLSGVSAPSPPNPFQSEPQKPSLNQIGSAPAAPLPPPLPYSASLPLPTNHQGASLPSSLTHPPQPGLDLPGKLPEPLLPFSSAINQESHESNQNPFLL
ncbi:epsin-3 isoform X2 [Austrofundulus limnaeus]|uniref:Epsin-3 isoform X2 n=1 Tax=Austrofundulus limnaeus TaxID=52670 RepID=A0A2I4CLC4_AUSLI|nr:PREDICTED: epsin-3 isoform X2 [Austrofundulus limnaeus]